MNSHRSMDDLDEVEEEDEREIILKIPDIN
jgi:hypothetical protein